MICERCKAQTMQGEMSVSCFECPCTSQVQQRQLTELCHAAAIVWLHLTFCNRGHQLDGSAAVLTADCL